MTPVQLEGLAGTLLFTLRARAEESSRPNAILRDDLAVQWYQRIVVPPEWTTLMETIYTPVFQLGTAVRTRLYDDITMRFLAQHPTALVVELGAGLSTRYHRCARPGLHWVEVDLPSAIACRRQLEIETAVHQFLPASITDPTWLSALPRFSAAEILFLAEGVLFFLSPDEMTALFCMLTHHFPTASIGLDVLTQQFSPHAQSAFAAAALPMQWLVAEIQEVSDLGVVVQQQWTVTHEYLSRWQELGFSPQKLLASQGNIVLTGLLEQSCV